MSDITTVWTGAHGDCTLAGSDLQSGSDLATAILLSLFTDRRAEPDDQLLDGSDDRRGWWGDTDDQHFGSRLWLIERAKRTQETIQRAKGYIEEALQWLIDDGVVASFQIKVEWPAGSQLSSRVVAIKGDGSQESMRFAWAWAA
jgi:phage gp46-like protein